MYWFPPERRRSRSYICFFNDTATTEIYTRKDTLSLHDALPISPPGAEGGRRRRRHPDPGRDGRSEEHTSELQSPFLISYAVFCLKKKNIKNIFYIIYFIFITNKINIYNELT